MSFVLDYKDKVVLVTGVSSGIGLGVAREFARAGAHVAGCSRKSPDDASVQAFREVVEQEGVRSFYRPADVTDAEELKGFVEEAARTFGRIDMVVSNAGMNVFEGAEGCTEERWHYNLDLNLASHWRLARLCKPYLEKSGEGVLLLMTSNHAFSSIPGCFPYNVTKTAITGLVRSLAIEWGPAVRTVGVAPGFIRRTIDLHPVKRIGTVEEVGALCVYLASPYARFISGTTILMDGGRSALMQDE